MLTLDMIRARISALRSMERVITEQRFNNLNDENRQQILNAIDAFDNSKVKRIILESEVKDPGEMTLKQLRELAKRRGIIGFMQLNKPGLLSELSKLEGLSYEED